MLRHSPGERPGCKREAPPGPGEELVHSGLADSEFLGRSLRTSASAVLNLGTGEKEDVGPIEIEALSIVLKPNQGKNVVPPFEATPLRNTKNAGLDLECLESPPRTAIRSFPESRTGGAAWTLYCKSRSCTKSSPRVPMVVLEGRSFTALASRLQAPARAQTSQACTSSSETGRRVAGVWQGTSSSENAAWDVSWILVLVQM